MILSEEKRQEFIKTVKPLMEWLNIPGNAHPHCHVYVDSGRAELSEGVVAFVTEEYIRD